ncbi:uncharacterized protein LOC127714552 isoform X2 [Mytilus californianus]|uniref:uncharacterized protein LOC127714552 isoform X2 n=1 Tax=Mytilus californianus TaxID=6549 RepID=UPI002247AC32|nr:uncharacterized protein LOC127714552 isoform X2 [Mytilus californianus]
MSAYEDSQEERQDDLPSQSQDLFPEEVQSSASLDDNIGRQILAELKSLQNRMGKMEENMTEMQRKLLNAEKKAAFSIDSCTFKKKLCSYLKDRFTSNPWLEPTSDVEFKNEVKKFLRADGLAKDTSAYKQVVSFSSSKYADLRNQLRRKIFQELTEGKNDLQSLQIDDFAKVILSSFCSALESYDSQERIKLCLVLRSFLHKRGLFATKQSIPDFWDKFKNYFMETTKGANDEKWEKLAGIDSRRIIKRLEVLGN